MQRRCRRCGRSGGNPRETTVLELAQIVKRLPRSPAPIVHAELPKDDPCRRNPDIGRAQELLEGWTPRVPLEEGLARTVESFRERLGVGRTNGARGRGAQHGAIGAAR